MNELEVKNTVWQWLYDNGFNAYDPKVFRPIYEMIKKKLAESDDDSGEDGSLQQLLIAEKMKVKQVVVTTLEATSNKEVDRFVANIWEYDLFEQAISNSKKRASKQNEELDEEVDLSDLDIDNLKL